MIGYAADAAAAEEAMKERGEIRKHFPSFFRAGPMRERPLAEELSAARERTERFFAQISGERQGFVPLGSGGVLKGLWDLGEKYSSGMEDHISVKRCSSKSAQPPIQPCSAPAATPSVMPTAVSARAKSTLTRKP